MNNTFAITNNQGISQLAQGRFADAIGTFLSSLRDAKKSLSEIANYKGIENDNNDSACDHHSVVITPIHSFRSRRGSSSLYLSPFRLDASADFTQYATAVQASVAIMYNMALAHHLNALYNTRKDNTHSGLDQAVALYELAYNVHMQEEDANLSVEFTMAIVNNLGHIHREKGDETKADQCFRHLLSTVLFLQSYGQENKKSHTPEVFLESITHLILKSSAAAAA
jgi:tetratricopeptide (TPR) repeat protein